MTRDMVLHLHDGVYCEKVQREQNKQLVDWYKKTLCEDFIRIVFGESPERIKVEVTDRNITNVGWVSIRVMKQGFYRWSWWFEDKRCVLNRSNGVYRACEDILLNMFPNDFDERVEKKTAKEMVVIQEGKGMEEYFLWVRAIKI